jgi:hypothetical protein
MIDGFAGDVCDYSIAPVSGVNILTIDSLTTPPPHYICLGQSTVLHAQGGNGTYTWSPATGLSSTTGANVTANPTTTTVYTLNSTGIGLCAIPLINQVTVNVSTYPNLGIDKSVTIQRTIF